MSDKVYIGRRHGAGLDIEITVDGKKLFNYDPYSEGLEWGYDGTGPRALAYSLLCHYFGAHPTRSVSFYYARDYHRLVGPLTEEIVSKLPREGFTLTEHELGLWLLNKSIESRRKERV